MVKHFTLSALFAFLIWQANAQQADVALATVRYELVHVNDTNDRDNPRKEEMVVHLGRHASMYLSHSLSVRQKEIEEKLKAANIQLPNGAGVVGGTAFSAVSIPGVTNENLFAFPHENKLVLSDRIGPTVYTIDLSYPDIDWQIAEEVKEIGGYQAQKATGSFGGRDYTAWFTTELPFPYGPWKLHGLPGLILEAADSKNEVVFSFLEFTKDTGAPIALPENATKARLRDFTKAKEAFQANPGAAFSGSAPAGAGHERIAITVNQDGVRKTVTGDEARELMENNREERKRKNNNPLELTEN